MSVAQRLIAAAVSAGLVGCATQARLTVLTEPAGGYVREQGGGLTPGLAPASISYDPKALQSFKDAAGCYLVRGVEVTWSSGATARSESTIRLCGSATGSYSVTLARDPGHPGLDKDLQFAAQLAGVAAQQARANAANTAAAAALLQAGRPKAVQGPGNTAGPMGFLKREYVSGFNKICIYDKLGSEYAVTISSVSLCQLSVP